MSIPGTHASTSRRFRCFIIYHNWRQLWNVEGVYCACNTSL